MKKLLIIFISVFTLIGCDDSGIKIIGHYRIYDYVAFDYNGNYIRAENVLKCKLASKNDPFIENVVQVEWNESTIIAETNKGYFVIESNSYGLCCGCGNNTIGPLNVIELKNYKDETNFEPNNEEKIK